jgi:polysaccharide export outer membrane protein
MVKKFLYLCLIILQVGLVSSVLAQENYQLGPEDEIEIKVWDHDDLTRKTRVSLDSRISFPFVGEINVKGLTLIGLQKELARRLSQGYIIDPHVSIIVLEHKSQKFFVLGNVKNSGMYPLTKPITVAEAISCAGGLLGSSTGKPASDSIAIVVRAQPGAKMHQPLMPNQSPGSQNITVNLFKAQSGDPKHNLEIKSGDTLYVPMLVFYATGEVKKPGRYPYEENMTILMASRRGVHILRDEGGKKEKIKINLDDHFKPGDTLVVPESFF